MMTYHNYGYVTAFAFIFGVVPANFSYKVSDPLVSYISLIIGGKAVESYDKIKNDTNHHNNSTKDFVKKDIF